MKITVAFALVLMASSALSQDITLRNKTATFTNLEGKLFKEVELVKADRLGLIWRIEASGGRIYYTNIDPMVLESFGVSSNRIEAARAMPQRRVPVQPQKLAKGITVKAFFTGTYVGGVELWDCQPQ